MGEVIGFREWTVSPALELRSTVMASAWVPGVNRAACRAGGAEAPVARGGLLGTVVGPAHEGGAPHSDCGCGLYALHALPERRTEDVWWPPFSPPFSFWRVTGVVCAWGVLEVHRSGFRAQYARPVLLGVDDASPAARRVVVAAVARRYGVPLVSLEELASLAREYGDPVPADSIPSLAEAAEGVAAAHRQHLARTFSASYRADLTTGAAGYRPLRPLHLPAARVTPEGRRARVGRLLATPGASLVLTVWFALLAVAYLVLAAWSGVATWLLGAAVWAVLAVWNGWRWRVRSRPAASPGQEA